MTIGDEILLKNSVEIILNIINQYSYDHIILDVLNIKKSENSKIRKKKFDFEKFKKNEGLKLISKERLLKFTHSQIGMMNKYFPQFSSNLNFNIKNNIENGSSFIKLASNLNGYEFQSFMMGESSFLTKLKIVKTMPKIPFIKEIFNL